MREDKEESLKSDEKYQGWKDIESVYIDNDEDNE